jgi:adenylate cyclase
VGLLRVDLSRVLSGDPGETRSGAVRAAVRELIVLVVALSHLIGAAIVILLLLAVLPLPHQAGGPGGLVERYWWSVTLYVSGALLLGRMLGLRAARPVMLFLADDRPPSEQERALVLSLPLRLMGNQLLLWAGALALFSALNAAQSATLALEVAVTVGLGGLATAAIAYLLTQWLSRAAVARVLAEAPPRRREVPGVGVRVLFSWGLGTAVPVAGALLVGAFALHVPVGRPALARATVVLSAVAIGVGLLAMVIFARSLTDPLRRLRDALASVEDGDLDVEVPVFDATEVGYAAAGFNRMVAGLRERERLRDLFGRQVGEDVARRALEEGVSLGGEEREAAALFVDVIGSTAFAHDRDPADVVRALNAFFEIVVKATGDHGGFVNKFAGDAALCVFGAPLAQSEPADCALRAARALRERLDAELDELRAGIGVSAGTVVAGNVGTADRYEYTVVGDPVNEAARLTELAKDHPHRLLVSQSVVERAGADEARRWRPAGEETLRGRRTPTTLYEPAGPR